MDKETSEVGFTFCGYVYHAPVGSSATEILCQFVNYALENVPEAGNRYLMWLDEGIVLRQWLSKNKEDLYQIPTTGKIHCRQATDGYFLDVHSGTKEKHRTAKQLCASWGLEYGKDAIIRFPKSSKKQNILNSV